MDEEILAASSTMSKSFENIDNGEIDEDVNLIKYLLESHAAEGGQVGPASLLLSQLGLQLPNVSNHRNTS